MILRKSRRGGDIAWAIPDEQDFCHRRRSLSPRQHRIPQAKESHDHDRLRSIESSLGALAACNDRLLSQNEALQQQVAHLESTMANAPAGATGHVITQVRSVQSRVPSKIAEKIKEGKYIDFRDLLNTKEDANLNHSHTISTDNAGNQLVFKQAQSKIYKQEISWRDWGIAWSRFLAILTQASDDPSLAANLSHHFEVVNSLMQSGHNWRGYDEEFRKLVESDPIVKFGCLHFDLYQSAHIHLPNTSRPSGATLVRRFCYDYNSPAGCRRKWCKYSHSCSLCFQRHSALHCFSHKDSQARPNASFGVKDSLPSKDPQHSFGHSIGDSQPRRPNASFGRGQPRQASRGSFRGAGQFSSFPSRARFQGPHF